jgi:hypothetical protein
MRKQMHFTRLSNTEEAGTETIREIGLEKKEREH